MIWAVDPLHANRIFRPRTRPLLTAAVKAYHSTARATALRARGVWPVLPERDRTAASGLGRLRWLVERSMAWLKQFRRLRTRYERRLDIHEAFLELAHCVICWRKLTWLVG